MADLGLRGDDVFGKFSKPLERQECLGRSGCEKGGGWGGVVGVGGRGSTSGFGSYTKERSSSGAELVRVWGRLRGCTVSGVGPGAGCVSLDLGAGLSEWAWGTGALGWASAGGGPSAVGPGPPGLGHLNSAAHLTSTAQAPRTGCCSRPGGSWVFRWGPSSCWMGGVRLYPEPERGLSLLARSALVGFGARVVMAAAWNCGKALMQVMEGDQDRLLGALLGVGDGKDSMGVWEGEGAANDDCWGPHAGGGVCVGRFTDYEEPAAVEDLEREIEGGGGLPLLDPQAGFRRSRRLADYDRADALARATARKTRLMEGTVGTPIKKRWLPASDCATVGSAGGPMATTCRRALRKSSKCGVLLSPEEAQGLVEFLGSA